MEGSGYTVAVIACRQDATNSKLKQCHLELECGVMSFSKPPSSDPSMESMSQNNALDSCDIVKYISDVIPVDQSTGAATVGMTLKMLESLGCITWRELMLRKNKIAEQRCGEVNRQKLTEQELKQYLVQKCLRQVLHCFVLFCLSSSSLSF